MGLSVRSFGPLSLLTPFFHGASGVLWSPVHERIGGTRDSDGMEHTAGVGAAASPPPHLSPVFLNLAGDHSYPLAKCFWETELRMLLHF